MHREDFPILKQDFIYLDNGATTLKPYILSDSISDYYNNDSNEGHIYISICNEGDKTLNLKKGDKVGYENGFVAKSKMKIAVLSIGYADGYLRCFSNNSKVIIKHQFANIVGNVCMDMCFCDVTNINCKIFDDATILGQYEDLSVNAEELAKNGNTISYEILTNIKRNRFNIIKR